MSRGDFWSDTRSEDNEQRQADCLYVHMMGLGAPQDGDDCDNGPPCPCAEGDGFPDCRPPPGGSDPTQQCASCAYVLDMGLSGPGGRRVAGFDLGAGPVDVYASLTAAQQAWVQQALGAWLNDPNVQGWWNVNQSACPSVSLGMNLQDPAALHATVGCFQAWFNAQASQGGNITTGGVVDQMTLAALMAASAQASWGAAVGSCPGSCGITPSGGTSSSTSSSKWWWIAGGIAAVGVVGGIFYVMSRGHHAAPAGA